MQIDPATALFILTEKGSLPPSSLTMSDIYAKEKSDDGFLYLLYSGESTFG